MFFYRNQVADSLFSKFIAVVTFIAISLAMAFVKEIQEAVQFFIVDEQVKAFIERLVFSKRTQLVNQFMGFEKIDFRRL
jgi:hypothetical protein